MIGQDLLLLFPHWRISFFIGREKTDFFFFFLVLNIKTTAVNLWIIVNGKKEVLTE